MRGMDGMEEGINLGMIGTRRHLLNLHGIQMLVYASMAVWSVTTRALLRLERTMNLLCH